eukprot:gene3982-7934_t
MVAIGFLMGNILGRRVFHSSRCFRLCSTNLKCLNIHDTSKSLVLNEGEEALFTIFRNIVHNEAPGTTVRVAGGWVRDKLLGFESKNDIDIALDNMSGTEFAAALNRWSKTNMNKLFRVGVIQQNPEKSKHLETATVQIGIYSIDFVNLRTETYAENSRIPIIQIGTPVEDALRRDLTINSLFYNINTKQLEDFTEKGLLDLSTGTIRTPLPSLITLLDDPLRILRAIRFACRFQFTINDELYQAANNNNVITSLYTKVSRERIADEVIQMFLRDSYPRAVALLHALKLLPLVFMLPEGMDAKIFIPGLPDATLESTPADLYLSTVKEVYGDGGKLFHEKGMSYLLITAMIQEQHQKQSSQSRNNNHDNKSKTMAINDVVSRSRSSNEGYTLYEKLPEVSRFLQSMENNLQNTNSSSNITTNTNSSISRKLLCLSAFCLPAVGKKCFDPRKPKRHIFLYEFILQRRLCLSVRDVTDVATIFDAIEQFTPILETCLTYNNNTNIHKDLVATTTTSTPSMGVVHPPLGSATSLPLMPPVSGPCDRLSLGLALTVAGPLTPIALLLATVMGIHTDMTCGTGIGTQDSAAVAETVNESDMNMMLKAILGISNPAVGSNSTSTSSSSSSDSDYVHTSHTHHTNLSQAVSRRLFALETLLEARLALGLVAGLVADPQRATGNDVNDSSGNSSDSSGYGRNVSLLVTAPLLDGNEIKQLLKNIPKGREFQQIMTLQTKWSLCYPNEDKSTLKRFLTTYLKNDKLENFDILLAEQILALHTCDLMSLTQYD